ncbi:MAG: transcriptional repressor [Acidimicrobiia bacterium]|nr:transcriptional repressor [Acidimicrobiia bacterium]
MRSPDELTTAFRAQGLKMTPQRQAIFRALHQTTDHPTAESVYAMVSADMPSISLRTVYQTLNDLTTMGELVALDLGTGSTRFDPTADDHHHLVCVACGAVHDLFLDVQVAVPAAQAAGFSVGRPEITWRGMCPSCSDRPPAPQTEQPAQREETNA